MKSEITLPSRCTADLPDELEQEHLVSELKLDGSRYVLYLGAGVDPYERQKLNALLSRRVSSVDNKHVDKTANIPHITANHYADLDGTVLDGECFLTDFATTQGVMGSSPKVAAQKQENGQIVYWAFDCMVYRGKDIRGRPLSERRKILESVVKQMGNPHVKAMPQWQTGHSEIFHKVVSRGGEGLIIKDLRTGYGIGWAKYKRSSEVSCFISGYKQGNGKYSEMIGAIAVSAYDESGNIIEVGFASGFSDAIRAEITANQNEFLYRVVDLFAHEISKTNRLRHPTFYRFREDLDETDCTLDKLKSDLKIVRKNRSKFGE